MLKFRLSWPTGIIIAFASFIIFILSFLYKATFIAANNHDLVSEEYYKDELEYQNDIDKLNNSNSLEENIVLSKTEKGLIIKFPAKMDYSKISGIISFKRLANSKIDFQLPIKLNSEKVLIKDENLVDGRWDVRIDWTFNETDYLYKNKIMY